MADTYPAKANVHREPEYCLEQMTQQNAVEFIQQFGRLKIDTDSSKNIAEALCFNQLALSQATAYMCQNRKNAEAYISLYNDFLQTTEFKKVEKVMKCDNLEKAVCGTCLLSLSKLKNLLSGKPSLLLYLCAYLHHNDIPAEIFENEELLTSKSKVTTAVKLLSSYALLKQNEKKLLVINPFVQKIVRAYLLENCNFTNASDNEAEDLDVHDDVILPLSSAVLTTICPEEFLIPADYKKAQAYLPHMIALGQNILEQSFQVSDNETKKNFEELAEPVLDACLVALIKLNEYGKAKEVGDKLLEFLAMKYGTNHVEFARTLGNLGVVAHKLGDIEMALAMFTRVLKAEESHYGKDHSEVAKTLENYANVVSDLRRHKEAKELRERALEIKRKTLGEDDISTAKTMGNLAMTHHDLNDTKGAIDMFQKALSVRENHYGIDHIENLELMEGLALAKNDCGDMKTAESLLLRVLNAKETLFGEGHPQLVSTLCSLAMLFHEKNPKKAKELYDRSSEIETNHNRTESIEMGRITNNLATVMKNMGDFEKAESLCKTSVKLKENLFGSDSVEIAITLYNLAGIEKELGDKQYANDLLQKAKEICEKNPEDCRELLRKIESSLEHFTKKTKLK